MEVKKVDWCFIISIILWCAITLVRVFNHSPWYDEAHAWLIAQELDFIEIIKYMKLEGHTFLWYLCLMPFAKTNFMYPYSMLLLNWLFCFIAILILWLKSPFNNWIKFLISFSFPFLVMYPVVARCYAIGIMLLFALAAMENKKLEHPNWYALLLVLCANTSIMAAVGATVFGGIFLYEMIKNRLKALIPLFIMVLGAVMVLMQLPFSLKGNAPAISNNMPLTIDFFNSVFFTDFLTLNLGVILFLSILILIFFIKNKIFPIFLISSYILLFFVFFMYIGTTWHHFFYYIYFIISCWLLRKKNINLKFDYIISLLLFSISLLFVFYRANEFFNFNILKNNSKYSALIIKNDKNFKDATFLLYNHSGYELYPYLKYSGINFVNYCSEKTFSYNSESFYDSNDCKCINSNFYIRQNGYKYDRLLKHNKTFVIDDDSLIYRALPTNDKNYYIIFMLYKKLRENLNIYSVAKIKI